MPEFMLFKFQNNYQAEASQAEGVLYKQLWLEYTHFKSFSLSTVSLYVYKVLLNLKSSRSPGADFITLTGNFEFTLAGILMPFYSQHYLNPIAPGPESLKFVLNANEMSYSLYSAYSMDTKNYTLKEVVYTFTEMGFTIKLPSITGISDYSGVIVNHGIVTATRSNPTEDSLETISISEYDFYYYLPQLAVLYLLSLSSFLLLLFRCKHLLISKQIACSNSSCFCSFCQYSI